MHCGSDYNCFYEEESKRLDREKELENEYRGKELQMQKRQLEQVEEQNEILDEQLEFQQEESEKIIHDQS